MKLEDTDKMPIGKYKGIPMMDVPVNWLHWYWHNADKKNDIGDYIRRNISGLKMENKDLIWS